MNNGRLLDLDKFDFASRLRIIKAIKNLTSFQLAEKLNVCLATLSRYENGHFEPRTKLIIQKLEDFESEVIAETIDKQNTKDK